jgi:thiol-disulfide isomerase/thioredoxin
MKKLFLASLFSMLTIALFAQTAEVSYEKDGTKVLKGFVTGQQLGTDTSFKWFGENQKGYTPYAAALQAVQGAKSNVHYLVFGGTWCHDTQFILPKFYSLTNAAGVPAEKITLLGVDRQKKTVQQMSEAFNITNVPTIIVLKDGKEIGRVVEYGKTGMFDRELGEIIAASK